MITIHVKSESNGRFETDMGVFYLESLYYVEDILISEETGDIFPICGTTTDENGKIVEIQLEG